MLAVALCSLPVATLSAKDGDEAIKREQGDKLLHLEGKPAPALEVGDWIQTEGDKALALGELEGKVVLLDFWGTW